MSFNEKHSFGNLLAFARNIYFKPRNSKLYEIFKKEKDENNTLTYKIIGVKSKGFKVKVLGVYAYLSFSYTPWKYIDSDYWNVVFPYLKGKVFFCKIYKISKEPFLVMVDSTISQFKKFELVEDEIYSGLIINKTDFGVFVEFGYHFNWNCGSINGFLHKSSFKSEKEFNLLVIGQIIIAYYWGLNKNEQYVFGKSNELKKWCSGEISNWLGKTVIVNIVKTDESLKYMVYGKYPASIPIDDIYYRRNKKRVVAAINNLKNGDVIHCKVVYINREKHIIQLKWNQQLEINANYIESKTKAQKAEQTNNQANFIQNRINADMAEKLSLIGKTVEAKVIKKIANVDLLSNSYILNDKTKYKVKIIFTNDTNNIDNKEIKSYERNLKNGDILKCEVLIVKKNSLTLNHIINDERLT